MIRRAQYKDIPRILELLAQVDMVHHKGRPDIFKIGTKYNENELVALLSDEKRPILVSTDQNDDVAGYCFCIYQQHIDNSVLTDIKTLYIDDLCVDEARRGEHIGRELYEAALQLARESGCYNLSGEEKGRRFGGFTWDFWSCCFWR